MHLTMPRFVSLTATLLAMAVLLGTATPAQAKGNQCFFQVKGLSMSFGALTPGSGISAVAPLMGIQTAGDCASGHTLTISGDNGLNHNGRRNLKNAAGHLIPYTLNGLPQSFSGPGNGTYAPFNFSGLILWADYADATAGIYSDRVIISVDP